MYLFFILFVCHNGIALRLCHGARKENANENGKTIETNEFDELGMQLDRNHLNPTFM